MRRRNDDICRVPIEVSHDDGETWHSKSIFRTSSVLKELAKSDVFVDGVGNQWRLPQ